MGEFRKHRGRAVELSRSLFGASGTVALAICSLTRPSRFGSTYEVTAKRPGRLPQLKKLSGAAINQRPPPPQAAKGGRRLWNDGEMLKSILSGLKPSLR
jgi:hypothetical protein